MIDFRLAEGLTNSVVNKMFNFSRKLISCSCISTEIINNRKTTVNLLDFQYLFVLLLCPPQGHVFHR